MFGEAGENHAAFSSFVKTQRRRACIHEATSRQRDLLVAGGYRAKKITQPVTDKTEPRRRGETLETWHRADALGHVGQEREPCRLLNELRLYRSGLSTKVRDQWGDPRPQLSHSRCQLLWHGALETLTLRAIPHRGQAGAWPPSPDPKRISESHERGWAVHPSGNFVRKGSAAFGG
jgi:hypothetical protein